MVRRKISNSFDRFSEAVADCASLEHGPGDVLRYGEKNWQTCRLLFIVFDRETSALSVFEYLDYREFFRYFSCSCSSFFIVEPRKSQKTKKIGTVHSLPKYDGDIFLKGAYEQVYPDEKDFPDPVQVRYRDSKAMPKNVTPASNLICNKHTMLIQKQGKGTNTEYTISREKKYQPKDCW